MFIDIPYLDAFLDTDPRHRLGLKPTAMTYVFATKYSEVSDYQVWYRAGCCIGDVFCLLSGI
jgi:hypothetical protein